MNWLIDNRGGIAEWRRRATSESWRSPQSGRSSAVSPSRRTSPSPGRISVWSVSIIFSAWDHHVSPEFVGSNLGEKFLSSTFTNRIYGTFIERSEWIINSFIFHHILLEHRAKVLKQIFKFILLIIFFSTFISVFKDNISWRSHKTEEIIGFS